MSCKLKGMQGFPNVLKYIAADSGKVGGCGNLDCLSLGKLIVMTRVASDIQPSSRWNSGGRRLVLKPLGMVCLVL